MRYYLHVIFIFLYYECFEAFGSNIHEEDVSEQLVERAISNIERTYHQEEGFNLSYLEQVGYYVPSYEGESNKKAQTIEFPSYDKDSFCFVAQAARDGSYEFVPIDSNEKSTIIQAQSAPISNLEKLQDKKVKRIPYRYLGVLVITFPKGQADNFPVQCVGSGVLIGPNHVLTAAHNLYDHTRGGWAQEVIFTPGQYKNIKPFGDKKGNILKVFKGWIENKDDNLPYDMGIIILEDSVGYQTGWASLLASDEHYLDNDYMLTIAGYPAKRVKIKTLEKTPRVKSAQMYKNSGRLIFAEKKRLTYDINTLEGQSGSPIIAHIDKERRYYILGVHTHGGAYSAEGTLLTHSRLLSILETIKKSVLPPIGTTLSSFFQDKLDGDGAYSAEGTLLTHSRLQSISEEELRKSILPLINPISSSFLIAKLDEPPLQMKKEVLVG
ncbi:MAG: trypsin-like peptidase domain-containing protein [Alphaproteobacteria bacterium]|nr:trypsin-like peptidase domain-containing protein [Alphaproteobacteria bacterium]